LEVEQGRGVKDGNLLSACQRIKPSELISGAMCNYLQKQAGIELYVTP